MYYHGTKATFSEFTIPGNGKHGSGFYFTKDLNEAKHFAETLAGDGGTGTPKVYTVNLSYNNLFDTMNVSHCEEVCRRLGTDYKIPSSVGGPKEHHYYLGKQLKKKGLSENLNETLKELGFDGVFYEFMEHIIVFSPSQIEIISVTDI